ncbi:hypothetical protein F5Y19DRAFT_458271 [Xylariaceae sp. FL1651]|nr:hypothetical protein F5Y19DRAFT_458271 [Xylariaceae sp. FL1651]
MTRDAQFAQLREVVSGDLTTRAEVRYLKILLSRFNTDLIGELPTEIVTLIALCLEPRHIALCLRVSRTWRYKFLSDAVTTTYAKYCWPNLIVSPITQYIFLANLSRVGWAFRNFDESQAEGCVGPIERVRWDGDTHFKLDPEYHGHANEIPDIHTLVYGATNNTIKPTAIYSHGKVAWHGHHHFIVVDNLRAKTRKIFAAPSGIMPGIFLRLEALGSKLVIGTVERLLIAWDHINNQVLEKKLPCTALRCSTQDDKVGVVLYNGNIVVWTWGGIMTEIHTSPLVLGLSLQPPEARMWADCLNVVFDPRNSETIYLASGYLSHRQSHRKVKLAVYQFISANYVDSWGFEFLDPVHGIPTHKQLPIYILDYEAERGCIAFCRLWNGWLSAGPYFKCFVFFDKHKREFVSDSSYHVACWPNGFDDNKECGRDLDLWVEFDERDYAMKQIQPRPLISKDLAGTKEDRGAQNVTS